MDGGPLRSQRPGERRAPTSRAPEPVYRQPEELPVEPVAAVREEPAAPVSRSRRHRDEPVVKRPKKRLLLIVAAVIVVLLLIGSGMWAWQMFKNTQTGINGSEYQAVFFTNGQVYFGKLQAFNSQYMELTDIYYLQTSNSTNSTNPQQAATNENSASLVKLGSEIHGPEDQMMIARDQILFYENLKPGGTVSKSIIQYQKQHSGN